MTSRNDPSPSIPVVVTDLNSSFEVKLSGRVLLSIDTVTAMQGPVSFGSIDRGSIRIRNVEGARPVRALATQQFGKSRRLNIDGATSVPETTTRQGVTPVLIMSAAPFVVAAHYTLQRVSFALFKVKHHVTRGAPQIEIWPMDSTGGSQFPICAKVSPRYSVDFTTSPDVYFYSRDVTANSR